MLAPVADNLDSEFAKAAEGDPAALHQLLESYLPQLHSFVTARLGAGLRQRESSVDVVQSVCRQLLDGRSDFEFQGEDRFRAWLFTSALNKIREKHRFHQAGKRALGREMPAGDESWAKLGHFMTPSQGAIGKETAAALREALAALSEEHREVVSLSRVVGLPNPVIAEIMDRTEGAIRKLLARALLRLIDELRSRGVAMDALDWSP